MINLLTIVTLQHSLTRLRDFHQYLHERVESYDEHLAERLEKPSKNTAYLMASVRHLHRRITAPGADHLAILVAMYRDVTEDIHQVSYAGAGAGVDEDMDSVLFKNVKLALRYYWADYKNCSAWLTEHEAQGNCSKRVCGQCGRRISEPRLHTGRNSQVD